MNDDLLCLSALAVLSLLPVYHRFYDAAVLIIPLSWLMARLSAAATIRVAVGLTMIAAFFLPGGTLLQTLQDKGALSFLLKTNDWWNSLIMAHAAWCLLILALILFYEISHSAKVETAHVKTEETPVLVPITPASSQLNPLVTGLAPPAEAIFLFLRGIRSARLKSCPSPIFTSPPIGGPCA